MVFESVTDVRTKFISWRERMSYEKEKYREAVSIMKLLVDLFEVSSKQDRLCAELWETDPAYYGTDAKGIELQKGRSEAFMSAAETVKKYIPE